MPIEQITQRLFHTEIGNIIVSAIFGIGLAFIFSRTCKGNDCVIIRAPEIDEIKNNIYQIQDECYTYTPKIIPCNHISPSTQIISNN